MFLDQAGRQYSFILVPAIIKKTLFIILLCPEVSGILFICYHVVYAGLIPRLILSVRHRKPSLIQSSCYHRNRNSPLKD